MKKIAFITGAMGRGGAERVISILSEHYAIKGWAVSILLLLHSVTAYPIHPEINIIDLSDDSVSPIKNIPRLVRRLRSYIQNEQPDVLVSFMAQNALVAGMACVGQKTRLVVSERIDPAMVKRGYIYKFALNAVYAHCSCAVMQTDRAKNYFPQKVQRNSVIIPNPIRVAKYTDENKRQKIVTAGRLEQQKNQTMLIEAFACIHKKHPGYALEIFGDGPLKNELQELIDRLDLTACATLKGNVSDIHEQIADVELFVLPSNFEGLSNALLEAMMMGLPCVSTDCAGSDEVITDGENGLLIPVGDTAALAVAIERIITNKALAEKLGQNARKSAEQFKIENIIGQWEKVIEG